MSAAEFPFTTEDYERFEQVRNGGKQDDPPPMPPAPEWPSDVFPPDIEAYVTAQAQAKGVPVDMVAVPLLAFTGAIVGNAVELQLRTDFAVLPSLWAAVIGGPGKKKTPALRAAQWPVDKLQETAHDEWQAAMAEFEGKLQRWKDAPNSERGEKPQPPRLDHLYSTDITLEALASYLEYCRGVAVIRDELAGFIGAMDKYRAKGDDRQQYLSLWAGAPIKVDRKGGGTTYTTHPVAAVYGGIQPDYAGTLHSADGRRDGMVERFLLFWPEVKRTGWIDTELDPALLEPVVDVLGTLRKVRKRTMLDVAADRERMTIRLHPDARALFIDWYNANDAAVERASGLRQGFYAKLDNQLARIALILHCLWNPDDPRVMLSATTMHSAIDIAEFFRSHLDRVLPLIGDTSVGEPAGLAARILRYLRTPDLQDGEGWVRRGDLYNRLRNVSASALSDELRDLKDRGAVESRTIPTGTKPSEQWRILSVSGSYNSDFSDYSASEAENPNSTNCKNGHEPDSGVDRESVLIDMWPNSRKGPA